MKLLSSISILLLTMVNGYIPTFKSHNVFFPFRGNEIDISSIDQHHIEPIINHIEKVKPIQIKSITMLFSDNDLFHHDYPLVDNFNNFMDENKRIIGRETVKKISSFLPHFDQIGHTILHANNEFISK